MLASVGTHTLVPGKCELRTDSVPVLSAGDTRADQTYTALRQEKDKWSRALVALRENLESVPRIHRVAQNL